MKEGTYGSHEVKIVDRSNISLSGVTKLISFDDEEFLMETVMGNLRLLGNDLELIKLDTSDGLLKIKGRVNSFIYIDDKKNMKESTLISKLFK